MERFVRLTVPELQLNDGEYFSTERDIFNRKPFGDHLYNLINNSEENLVLALDSQWGEGKSTFIKMWTNENKHNREVPLETIYFDAFQNDYQKEPFLALASEVYELLEDKATTKTAEFKKKAAKVFKTFSRGMIKTGVRIGTAGLVNDTLLDQAEKDISELVSEQVDSIISSKFESSKADKLALKNFKEFLSDIALNHTSSGKIVFVIDELDRCRPDFALDLLENIKHLFSVSGVTFLLVMNRRQLEESVKCRYGNGIDSVTYLQKFIDVWLSLPRKTPALSEQDDGVTYLTNSFKLMAAEGNVDNRGALSAITDLVRHLKPSFRDIERILTYFALIENSRSYAFNEFYQDIMGTVCFLKVTNPKLLDNIMNGRASSKDVLEHLQLTNQNLRSEGDPLKYLALEIEYDLSAPERKNEIESNERINLRGYPSGSVNIFKRFIEELSNIYPQY